MIESLTPEQEAKFPEYVKKWTDIGLNTQPCDVEVTKEWIKKAYVVAKLPPPTNFFHFRSPEEAAHAVFMVDTLTDFTPGYNDTKLYAPMEKWEPIFNEMYKQYSEQYDITAFNSKLAWNEDTKARMLSFVSKAYAKSDYNSKLKTHLQNMLYGAHDAAWLSFYDFFYQEFDLECTHDLIPSFEIAKNCGWWSAYGEAAFMQDRPTEIIINEDSVLHQEDGPCITYSDGTEIYCLENHWFPKVVVMNPEDITPDMIKNESNAEKRRIMLSRYGGGDPENGGGYLKFFEEVGATVIDRDFVVVDPEAKTTMPRMLVECDFGGGQQDLFLVGSDGSTERVYIMPVSSRDRVERRFGEIKTCRAAHELICGLDESKCVAQS